MTKYFELLLKAIFFKPINDLNEFVNNFLLPEKNVSIDNLRQNAIANTFKVKSMQKSGNNLGAFKICLLSNICYIHQN